MIDSTGDVTIPIGDSDATIDFFEFVDPIVDLWFSKRGKVSKRRFLNMANMRIKKLKLYSGWFDDAAIRQWVSEALQPGYRMSQPEPLFAPLGQETGPFQKSSRSE